MTPTAISNTTPNARSGPQRRSLVAALVEDRPDALVQTAGLLHQRAFTVESLVYGPSAEPGIARLTLALRASPHETARLVRELGRLLYVVNVESLDEVPTVCRELLLIKVAVEVDQRAEVLQLAEVFRARTIDVAPGSVTLEVTGDADKSAGLLELLRPYGLLELARTGPMALARHERRLEGAEGASSWLDHQRSRGAVG